MSENSQLSQMAENFRRSAAEQRSNTEKIVSAEFDKLQSVIAKESESAASTYSAAIHNLSNRGAISKASGGLQWLAAFLIGCALTAWLCLSSSYGIYSKSEGKLPVQTFTIPNMGSGWVICRQQVNLQGGQTACKME